MKRISSTLFALALVLGMTLVTLAPVAANGDTSIAIEDISVLPDEEITVPIMALDVDSACEVCQAGFDLKFDPAVVSVTNIQKIFAEDVAAYAMDFSNTYSGDFVLGYVTFKAVGNPGDSCQLQLGDWGNRFLGTFLSDFGGTDCPSTLDDGTFTILSAGPAGVETATGTGTAYFSASAGTLTGLSAVAEGSLPGPCVATKPSDLLFPHGLFSFDITGLTPGATVTVTITLPPGFVLTEYWKCHSGVWIQIPMTVVGPPNVIMITLVDGGLGDDDGLANGTIVDQGGPTTGPVGWQTHPVSKVRVLLPWIVLGLAIAAGASVLVVRRRRTTT
jgi:hypothetical protein